MQVEIDGLGLLGRPLRVSTPGVRSTLKSAGLPRRLLTFVVQVITEEGRFNVLAKLAGGLVPAERNDSDVVALGRAPFPVIPRARDDEVRVIGIVLLGVAKDLPRSPGIFLIPESGDVEVGNSGRMKLADPGFLFPEVIVVGMLHG